MLLHLVPVLSLLFVPSAAPPTAPPTVRLSGVRLSAGLGGAAAAQCTVGGWPLPAVRWLRQGVPVRAGAEVRLVRSATSNTVITLALHLTNLTSHTAGRYTCAARYTWEFCFLVLLSSILLFFCLVAGTRALYLRKMSETAAEQKYDCKVTLSRCEERLPPPTLPKSWLQPSLEI